jgi:predicted DNA-binding ribbon-helix-helix protein
MAVMHRTQVLLEQEQYERLKDEAERTGVSIGHLIRQALAEKYGGEDRREALRVALRESAGAWAGLEVDGEEYVERLRPGLESRWAEHEWA